MKYETKGKKEFAVRMGCTAGVYQFIHDYAEEMGMSASGALQRLAIIGARCESEHGRATMPASYAGLSTGTTPSKNLAEYMWKDDEDDGN